MMFLLASPVVASTLHDKAPGVRLNVAAPTLIASALSAGANMSAENRIDEKEDHASEFWPPLLGYRIKLSDSAIIIFTGFLVLYTKKLWRSTEKLWSAGERQITLIETNAKNQNRDMKESLRIAAEAAQASSISARSAADSAELGRRSFVFAQRPRLQVRNLVLNVDRNQGFNTGMVLIGTFDFANVGGSPAHVTDADSLVFWSKNGLPIHYPLGTRRNPRIDRSNKMPVAAAETLQSGEMNTGLFNSGMHTISPEEAEMFNRNDITLHLYVIGWIQYCDDFGTIRRCNFCREYRSDTGRFSHVNDPDYENDD